MDVNKEAYKMREDEVIDLFLRGWSAERISKVLIAKYSKTMMPIVVREIIEEFKEDVKSIRSQQ